MRHVLGVPAHRQRHASRRRDDSRDVHPGREEGRRRSREDRGRGVPALRRPPPGVHPRRGRRPAARASQNALLEDARGADALVAVHPDHGAARRPAPDRALALPAAPLRTPRRRRRRGAADRPAGHAGHRGARDCLRRRRQPRPRVRRRVRRWASRCGRWPSASSPPPRGRRPSACAPAPRWPKPTRSSSACRGRRPPGSATCCASGWMRSASSCATWGSRPPAAIDAGSRGRRTRAWPTWRGGSVPRAWPRPTPRSKRRARRSIGNVSFKAVADWVALEL